MPPDKKPKTAEPDKLLNVNIVDPSEKRKQFIAYAAILISLCAFILSIHQSCVSSEVNRLSNIPFVDFVVDVAEHDNPVKIGIFVMNDGLGPAVIKKLELYTNGKLIDTKEKLKRSHNKSNLFNDQLPTLAIPDDIGFLKAGEKLDYYYLASDSIENIDELKSFI